MKKLVILGSMLLSSAAAQADPAGSNAAAGDPNETICQMVSEIGSRVSRHRTCMTRAAWAEHRRQVREGINRAQTRQFNIRIDERVLVEMPR